MATAEETSGDLTLPAEWDELKSLIQADARLSERELRIALANERRKNEQLRKELESEKKWIVSEEDERRVNDMREELEECKREVDAEFTLMYEQKEKLTKEWQIQLKKFDIDKYAAVRSYAKQMDERHQRVMKGIESKVGGMEHTLDEIGTRVNKIEERYSDLKQNLQIRKSAASSFGSMIYSDLSDSKSKITLEDWHREYLWQISMVMRYTFRGYFGIPFYKKWGHFLDKYMSSQIHQYAYEVHYPEHFDEKKYFDFMDSFCCGVIATDGRYLFFSHDTWIHVLDLVKDELVHKWKAHDGSLSCLAYHPGILVSGGHDKMINIWDSRSLDFVAMLMGHKGWVMSVDISAGADQVISASRDREIREWSVDSGECLRVLAGHSGHVSSVQYIGEDVIISGSLDKSVRMWNTKMHLRESYLTKEFKGKVSEVHLNCDSTLLACVCNESSIKVLTWPDLKTVKVLKKGYYYARFHPNRRNVIAAVDYGNSKVRLMDAVTAEILSEFDIEYCRGVLFTPDGRRLVAHGEVVRVFQLSKQE